MKRIYFKQKYFNIIKNETKNQTIRFWKKCNLKKNEKIILYFGNNVELLEGIITTITIKKYNDLTLEQIKNDGYSNKENLLADLIKFYPNFNQEKDSLFLITFKVKND